MIYNAPYGNAAYCYFDYQSYGTSQHSAVVPAFHRPRGTDLDRPEQWPGIAFATTASEPQEC